MLTIKNINKLVNRKLIGGWVVRDMNYIQKKYMFDIQCMSPIGVCMDRCTVSLNRIGIVQRTLGRPVELAYFLYYNGERTDVCVTKDWILNPENFISQLKYIINEYHNKQ
jgi:hypothetical protein